MAAALAGVAVCQAASAQAVAGSAAVSLRRIATTDGAVAVMVPCTVAEGKQTVTATETIFFCTHGSLEYFANMGKLSTPEGGGTYAGLLAAARKEPTAGKIVELTIAGCPAFSATRPPTDPLTYAMVVDVGHGRVAYLVARQHDDHVKLGRATRAAAEVAAKRFMASLELNGK